MCIAESDNSPAMCVVGELLDQYPSITAKVFVGGEPAGVNPKINNMMAAYRQAQYDLIWICDSSIAALPTTLHELVSHIGSPEVALVHQPPYIGPCAKSLPAMLDKVYFGTQHLRVYLVANYFGQNCANGMSWLIRKTALESVGGLISFSDYLAEDFTIGKALWTRRWKLAMSTMPALQSGEGRTLSLYQARMVRWGRLRATMMPWPGLLEPFTECLVLGLLASAATSYLFGVGVVQFMAVHVSVWFCCDYLLLTIAEGGLVGPLWKVLLVWMLREVWTFPLFLAGVWSREVVWRGKRYRLKMGGKAVKLD